MFGGELKGQIHYGYDPLKYSSFEEYINEADTPGVFTYLEEKLRKHTGVSLTKTINYWRILLTKNVTKAPDSLKILIKEEVKPYLRKALAL